MSVRLTSNGRHTRNQREHAPAVPAADWDSAVARSLRPARSVRASASDGACDGAPQGPLTAAEGLALVLVFLASGGFILTDDPVLGLVSAALSWVLFALCCFQGFRHSGRREGRLPIEKAPRRRR